MTPLKLLQEEQTKPNFNHHVIDYVYNTVQYSKEYLQSHNFNQQLKPLHLLNISSATSQHIDDLEHNPNIVITQTDKNLGWAFLPITWFNAEYERHLNNTQTYKLINDFYMEQHITDGNTSLSKF